MVFCNLSGCLTPLNSHFEVSLKILVAYCVLLLSDFTAFFLFFFWFCFFWFNLTAMKKINNNSRGFKCCLHSFSCHLKSVLKR